MIDTTELDEISARLMDSPELQKKFVPFFKQGVTLIHQHSIDEAPYKLGQLRKSIDIEYKNELTAIIGSDDSLCPYAKFVYGGTKAHTIKTANKKALQFVMSGKNVFAKSAKIPAIPPNPYLAKTWEKHKLEFTDILKNGYIEVIEGNT